MSRRDKLRQAYGAIYSQQTAPKAQQKKAEKICGLCVHYIEGAFTGEGRGSCNVLKMSSDISKDPPVYDMEGENGYRTMNLMDATRCKHYEKREFIDKDGTECNDPVYRRSMRQMLDD